MCNNLLIIFVSSIYYFFCLIPLATLTSLLALSVLFSVGHVLHYFLPSFSGSSERLILSHARTTHRVESFLFFSSRFYNKSLWDSNVVFNLFSCFESLRFLFGVFCYLYYLLSWWKSLSYQNAFANIWFHTFVYMYVSQNIILLMNYYLFFSVCYHNVRILIYNHTSVIRGTIFNYLNVNIFQCSLGLK